MKWFFADLIPDEDELDAFGEWAFGDNFEELLDFGGAMSFLEEWNRMHGDKLTLDCNGIIEHDAPKMVGVWKKLRDELARGAR